MLAQQIASLGPMAWPLIIASCLCLAMVLERLITYAALPSLNKKRLRVLFQEVRNCKHCSDSQERLCENLCKSKGIRRGIAVLLSHNASTKEMREEVATLWLLKQKRALQNWLKPLMLIGILSPMFGLLGTVLGLINMFQGIAASGGPVTPDVLAGGLWEAMYTTAFGLFVAIPALAGAHGLGVWANHYISKLEFAMNHVNLLMEGLDMNDDGFSPSEQKPCSHKEKTEKKHFAGEVVPV
ncbi:MotA/TolQ/ExbB proton channel family protein [Candidatus Sororendozoicomonas aggregata]|uniref:MotA/TolQ/ExbB proton channel family protein n=1 Tax=Candidatus Sororendozoicomonas aggregata TaxID=3073239 RepID=UPI002ED39682